jgi:4-amino-4-deoxy-L-arabinose transferase-like glycosyltransferase
LARVVPTGPANAADPARAARELGCVFVVAVLPLLWLSDRAFNIDEPLFLWLAEQIQREPLDFFGFAVNWYGSEQPMFAVTRNPPLTGYAIAAAASVVGWSERALHIVFALPAAVAAIATWALARRFEADALPAALLALTAPVFLICANTVMSDVSMLALWLLALLCWLRGVACDGDRWLWAAAALAGAAVWTKYFAIALVPLLAVHGLASGLALRRFGPPLLLPVVALGVLELAMNALYGAGALEQAMAEALHLEGIERPKLLRQTVEGLAFAGGCIAPALLLAPWLWRARALFAGGAIALVFAALAPASLGWIGLPVQAGAASSAATRVFALQLAAMVLGGVSLLALAVGELRRERDPGRWLLGLWLLGSFVFAAFVNWTNNGRSNLVLAPVGAILVVRRLRARELSFAHPGIVAASVACAVLALGLAWADRQWSNGVRAAASELVDRHGGSGTLWFHGHWGLQYYLEQRGARAVDWRRDVIRPGDRLIVAGNNAEAHTPREQAARLVDVLETAEPRWLHTQAKPSGASFNASNLGPLPYLLGPAVPDRYRVYRALREIRYKRWFGWAERAADE